MEIRHSITGIAIGSSHHDDSPTGCTVVVFPPGSTAAVDVRGGAAATRESDLFRAGSAFSGIDALVFAGGSTYGLAAATGVMERLLERREGRTGFSEIPSVPAAVVYDFAGREGAAYPTAETGKLAFDSARVGVAVIGRVGAGANVSVGKILGRRYAEPSGQGAAAQEWHGGGILALTVVNALGNVIGERGEILAGSRDPETGRRLDPADAFLSNSTLGSDSPEPPGGNTTLSLIVTDFELSRPELERFAAQTHAGLARVIEPFHCAEDGDTLFVASTRARRLPPGASVTALGAVAARLLQRAARVAVECSGSNLR